MWLYLTSLKPGYGAHGAAIMRKIEGAQELYNQSVHWRVQLSEKGSRGSNAKRIFWHLPGRIVNLQWFAPFISDQTVKLSAP